MFSLFRSATSRIAFIVLAMLAIGVFAMAAPVHAATDTWIASSAGNWSNASNWSMGAAPTASDTALFSSSSTQNATIDTGITVGGIDIASGYTGTIVQGQGNAITIGTSTASYGFSQAGGAFQGSTSTSDAITVNGPFSLAGGTFTSTAGTLTFRSNVSFSPGTFQNGAGLAVFDPTSTIPTAAGSAIFDNLQIGNSSSINSLIITTGTTLTAQGYLYVLEPWAGFQLLGGGAIDVQGNIEGSYAATYATGTASVALTGAGNQMIGDETVSGLGSGGSVTLPTLSITKNTGTVTFRGNIDIANNLINTNATPINPGTSTVIMGAMGVPGYNVPGPGSNLGVNNLFLSGSSTFYNLALSQGVITVATGTLITVQGYFYPQTNNSVVQFLGGGQFNLEGNVEAAYAPAYATGTASIVLDGSGAQVVGDDTLSGNGNSSDALVLPDLTIDKPSGTVVWGSDISGIEISGNFLNINATPIDPGTSTVCFGPGWGWHFFPTSTAATVTGSSTFYNLCFGAIGSNNPSGIYTVATGTVLAVENQLQMDANYSSLQLIGGGTIDIRGSIEAGYYPSTNTTGTVSIVLDGAGAQIVGDDAINAAGGNATQLTLPNLTVDKSSGIVSVNKPTYITGALAVANGDFLVASSTAAATLQVTGPLTVSPSGTLSDYAPSSASSTLILGSSLVNDGAVSFSGGGPSCGNPAGIFLQSAAPGVPVPWSGTGSFLLQNLSLMDQTTTLSLAVFNSTDAGDVGPGFSFIAGCPVPPAISSFSASPASITEGGSATLSWSVTNASSVTISPLGLSTTTLIGSFTVTPTSTTQYTLLATNVGASSTATAAVTVVPPAPASPVHSAVIAVAAGYAVGVPPGASSSPAAPPLPQPSSTDVAALQAELDSLRSMLAALAAAAAVRGIGATPPAYPFLRDLSSGDRGPDVMALQEYLNAHGDLVSAIHGAPGSPGYETAYFGEDTKRALEKFQASHGIPPTGFFGPITRGLMKKNG